MTGGEDEAIAVGPDRIIRVEAQVVLPELIGDRCEGHGGAGMPGVGGLNRVHGEATNRVNGRLNDLILLAHKLVPR